MEQHTKDGITAVINKLSLLKLDGTLAESIAESVQMLEDLIPKRVFLATTADAVPELKERLRELVRTCPVKVSFIKTDGSERVLTCTLSGKFDQGLADYYTAQDEKEKAGTAKPKKPENPQLLSVWDLEAKDWRCFRVDRVYDWEVIG